MSERDIQHQIQISTAYLVAWFRNQNGHYEQDGRHITYGIGGKGGADLIGIRRRDGRWVAVEVKAPGKKPRPEQERFLALVRSCNGIALWADNVEAVLEAVK